MEWAQVASQFAEDSSLRDIYISETTLEDWQKVLAVIRELDPSPAFFIDNEPSQLPEQAADMLAKRPEFGMLLKANVGGILVHCHPAIPDEINFDIERRDVDGPERFALLVGFMQKLANATQKVVTLAHEAAEGAVIGRVLPAR